MLVHGYYKNGLPLGYITPKNKREGVAKTRKGELHNHNGRRSGHLCRDCIMSNRYASGQYCYKIHIALCVFLAHRAMKDGSIVGPINLIRQFLPY